jgi:hypothetical protein
LLALAAGTAIAFLGYFFQIANLFYATGAYFWDTGWYAYNMSVAAFPPVNPPIFVEEGHTTYFRFHFAPIMSLWGTLSAPFGLAPAVSFGIFQGVLHAILFVIGFLWLRAPGDTDSRWLAPFLLGLLFAFNPITVVAIGYPHTETAIPALFLLFAFLAGRRRHGFALLAFALMLSVRGDAGFHAATFLWTFAIAEALSTRRFGPAVRVAAALGAAGFAYSVVAFTVQRTLFPGFDNLHSVYLGPGFFDHLSIELYVTRLLHLLTHRPELFAMWLAPVLWGAIRRDFAVFAGAAAVLPWFLLNISAVRGPPSELFGYYAFPFLIVFFWPLVVRALRTGWDRAAPASAPPAADYRWYAGFGLASYAALISGAMYIGAGLGQVPAFIPKIDLADVERAEATTRMMESAMSSGQAVFVDDGIASLNPELVLTRHRIPALGAGIASARPWVVFYFETYMQTAEIGDATGVAPDSVCLALPDSHIRIRYSADFAMPAPMSAELTGAVPCS